MERLEEWERDHRAVEGSEILPSVAGYVPTRVLERAAENLRGAETEDEIARLANIVTILAERQSSS